MIGYFLFYVESDNVCVVSMGEFQPIPLELLPLDLSILPGDFVVVSFLFQSILLFLFLVSIITSVAYV